MKPRKMTSALVILLALGAGLTLSGPAAQAAVPNTIAFQGYLTDPAGVPLNGTVSLIFNLYSVSTGGTSLWTETQPSVSVADGVFSVALGAVTPLTDGLFVGASRHLGIRVNGEAELPRTQLRTAPFAFQAVSADTVGSAIVIKGSGGLTTLLETGYTAADYYLTVNNNQGDPSVRLGSQNRPFPPDSNGYLELLDETGAVVVVLTAEAAGGGRLALRTNNTFHLGIVLDAGRTGDQSVQLPGSSISAAEIADEPGVAGASNGGAIVLSGPRQSILTRTIFPPGDGYILAIAACYVQPNHVNGTISQAQYGLSDDGVNFGTAQDVNVQVPSSAPTGNYRFPGHASGIFEATAGVSKTIHLLAEINSGEVWALGDISLNLLFVPESYGTVTPARPVPGGGADEDDRASRGALTPGEIAAERVESEEANRVRVDAELAAVRAMVDELRREMREDR